MRRVVVTSAARVTAEVMREAILSREDGVDEWFLGSEDDLMSRLGVSRPTLRQAARLLEHEGLLVVRRGLGGGLFGRRPTEEAVTHVASVLLRSQGTTYGDLVRTLHYLSSEAAQLAAQNPDRAARERVARFYDEHLPPGPTVTGADFIGIAGGFHVAIAECSGSPALLLFVQVLTELARPVGTLNLRDEERVRLTTTNHRRIAAAILAGNGRQAAGRMRDHLNDSLYWTDPALPLRQLEG